MFAIKFMLLANAAAMFLIAAAIVLHDFWMSFRFRRRRLRGEEVLEAEPVRARTVVALALVAWLPLLVVVGVAFLPAARAS